MKSIILSGLLLFPKANSFEYNFHRLHHTPKNKESYTISIFKFIYKKTVISNLIQTEVDRMFMYYIEI